MDSFARTPRTTVRRMPARASYDREVVFSILDEALVAHVGIAEGDQPLVIPMVFVRVGEALYLHGAVASRLLRALSEGVSACATVTLIDGLVLARSAMHHSMNYRSVVVLGHASLVTDPEERDVALAAMVDRLEAGRSTRVRPPNAKELAATRLVRLPLEEVSAKRRSGGPIDDEEDLALPVWAGHVPLTLTRGTPVPASDLARTERA